MGVGRNKSSEKGRWTGLLVLLFGAALGVACGAIAIKYLEHAAENVGFGGYLLRLAAVLVELYLSLFIQIVIHEAGHLVFGLLTGYKYSSFRVGSLMWIKETDGIKLRRFSLAGTGGQCLMAPPELKDGKIPYVLYNLGGSLMNIAAAAVCIVIALLAKGESVFAVFPRVMALMGLAFVLFNGVPMRTGSIDNDGWNALSLGRDPAALGAFWVQMQANALAARGVRLKDMPEEWFAVPEEESMRNSMVAALGVLACNRLFDERRFEEADALMKSMLESDSAITGVHRGLLVCDRAFCLLTAADRSDGAAEAKELLDAKQRKFMRSMGRFPSVMRTEYAYALIAEHDDAAAEKTRGQFEKIVSAYPYRSEADAERELMELARSRAAAEKDGKEKHYAEE